MAQTHRTYRLYVVEYLLSVKIHFSYMLAPRQTTLLKKMAGTFKHSVLSNVSYTKTFARLINTNMKEAGNHNIFKFIRTRLIKFL